MAGVCAVVAVPTNASFTLFKIDCHMYVPACHLWYQVQGGVPNERMFLTVYLYMNFDVVVGGRGLSHQRKAARQLAMAAAACTTVIVRRRRWELVWTAGGRPQPTTHAASSGPCMSMHGSMGSQRPMHGGAGLRGMNAVAGWLRLDIVVVDVITEVPRVLHAACMRQLPVIHLWLVDHGGS